MDNDSIRKKATLNVAVLDDLRKLDRSPGNSVVTELLDAFLTEVPSYIQKMRTALDGNNISDLRKVAHALKSNAGNLGADRFSSICQNIENGKEDSLKELVGELDTEFGHVADQMMLQIKKCA